MENKIDLIEFIEKNEKKIPDTLQSILERSFNYINTLEYNSKHKKNINRAFLISCCIDNDFSIFKQLINEIIHVNKFLLKSYVLEGLKFAYANNTNEQKIKFLESSIDFIKHEDKDFAIYLDFICDFNSSCEILENFLKKYKPSRYTGENELFYQHALIIIIWKLFYF